MVGCKTGASAIQLHDEVVSLLARLFRCLRVDAIVEPIRIFADLFGGGNSRRPDILLRNPRGFGRQVIIDVAITGIDGFESLASNAELYIFDQDDSQE